MSDWHYVENGAQRGPVPEGRGLGPGRGTGIDLPAVPSGFFSIGCSCVQAVLRHMWQEYPKEIAYRPETGDLELFFWPAGARAMDVRRYSNFPHLAQGETVSADNRWVQNSFLSRRSCVRGHCPHA